MPIPENLLEGIKKLEPMPLTAQKLMSALKDPDIQASDIAKIVELDQAVAANILKVANSAMFAGRDEIVSVRNAVVRLGTANLLTIVLDGFMKKMSGEAPLFDMGENELWLHGAAASCATTELMKLRPGLGIPGGAPVAALMHDVGKLLMSRLLKADVKALIDHAREKGVTFIEAERAILGCDHAEVGAALGRKWNFPEEMVTAIAYHHEPPPGGPVPIVDAVVFANMVAKSAGTGLGAEGMNFRIDKDLGRRLNVDFDDFCAICAATTSRVRELRKESGAAT